MSSILSTVVSIAALAFSAVAAVFACLAYLHQLRHTRYELKLVLDHCRDWTHTAVTATNTGLPCSVVACWIAAPGRKLPLYSGLKHLEHGATLNMFIEAAAYDQVSVDVGCRIVVELSQKLTLSSDVIRLSEVLDGEGRTVRIVNCHQSAAHVD